MGYARPTELRTPVILQDALLGSSSYRSTGKSQGAKMIHDCTLSLISIHYTTVFDLFYARSLCTPFRSWLAGISGMLMSKGISRFAFIVLWELPLGTRVLALSALFAII